MKVGKIMFFFNWAIFRFHVNFQGCRTSEGLASWGRGWHLGGEGRPLNSRATIHGRQVFKPLKIWFL